MTRDQLQCVLSMASYEVDAKAADHDPDYEECRYAYEAVKDFWAWMTARGLDNLRLGPDPYNRN